MTSARMGSHAGNQRPLLREKEEKAEEKGNPFNSSRRPHLEREATLHVDRSPPELSSKTDRGGRSRLTNHQLQPPIPGSLKLEPRYPFPISAQAPALRPPPRAYARRTGRSLGHATVNNR